MRIHESIEVLEKLEVALNEYIIKLQIIKNDVKDDAFKLQLPLEIEKNIKIIDQLIRAQEALREATNAVIEANTAIVLLTKL